MIDEKKVRLYIDKVDFKININNQHKGIASNFLSSKLLII